MDRFSRFARMLMPGETGEVTIVKRGMLPTLRVKENLAAWFRYGKGVQVNASNLVQQWDDASGNGRHLKQATETNRPTKQGDGSILFDGVDNYLKCDAFTLNQPITYYLLWKQVTWTDDDDLFDGDTAGSVLAQQITSTPRIVLYAGSANAPENDTFTLDTYAVTALVVNAASSVIQVNNGTPSTGNPGTNGAGGFTLGGNGSGTGNSNIQVKEVLIYAAAHDATTRDSVIKYLAQVGKLVI